MEASAGNALSVQLQYGGFWRRVAASIIDLGLATIIALPVLVSVYGLNYYAPTHTAGPLDLLLILVAPAIAVILFWIFTQASPGKIAMSLRIVDAVTGKKPTTGQFIRRYLGYYLSALALFLGFLYVAVDPRKQGLHDKLAGTVVVTAKRAIFSAEQRTNAP